MGLGVTLGLVVATFTASFVEFVEALTIVLAMGLTRGWRSTAYGVLTAVVALVGFTAVAGYALARWLPESVLQLVVGALLLIFGLQWLRKAVLRSSGLKALHDEDTAFADPVAAAAAAAAGVVVIAAGTLAHRPLSRIPENTLKYAVGLLLASFGTFWAVEGLGVVRSGRESLEWPGHDLMILVLLAAWFLVTRALVRAAPTLGGRRPVTVDAVGGSER